MFMFYQVFYKRIHVIAFFKIYFGLLLAWFAFTFGIKIAKHAHLVDKMVQYSHLSITTGASDCG